jgi:hypothetical protein
VYQRKITRKELAEMAGFSAAIYSYTATPSARDYRTISDDMRKQMGLHLWLFPVWKTTSLEPASIH